MSPISRCALVVLLIFSCDIAAAKQPDQLDLTSAVEIVQQWAVRALSFTHEAKLELQDVTTPEIWSVVEAQLFAKTPESFPFFPISFS